MKGTYALLSDKNEIDEFIKHNENTQEILDYISPHLSKRFPNSRFSLELCDELEWTTEKKLLVNVHVTHEIFFNGMISKFNEIYEKIDFLTEDIFCPIVLFPNLENENYDRIERDCVINLVARTAYFNNDFDKNMQREMSIRDIPKELQEKEIISYCKSHPNPDLSDIVYDLQLDLFDVDDITDELEERGVELNVRY